MMNKTLLFVFGVSALFLGSTQAIAQHHDDRELYRLQRRLVREIDDVCFATERLLNQIEREFDATQDDPTNPDVKYLRQVSVDDWNVTLNRCDTYAYYAADNGNNYQSSVACYNAMNSWIEASNQSNASFKEANFSREAERLHRDIADETHDVADATRDIADYLNHHH